MLLPKFQKEILNAPILLGLVLGATSCGSGGSSGSGPTPLVTLDVRYESPGRLEVPTELAANWTACVHTAAPLGDKVVRGSWAPTAWVALESVSRNVYAGQLTDAPADTPIMISIPDLALCDLDPANYPPLATRGVTVNGTVLTRLSEGAPLGIGFVFTVKPDGTVAQF
jgi:hypothetical protein